MTSTAEAYKIIIPGELPTMNQIVAASKKHWSEYNRMKRKHTETVAWMAKSLPKMEKIDVTITWYCKNTRKDKDNITSGQKFLFDGLVEAGVIDGDGWKQIGDISHKFEVDKHNPRVEMDIREVSE